MRMFNKGKCIVMALVDELINSGVKWNASDIHVALGEEPCMRVNGELVRMGFANIDDSMVTDMLAQLMCGKDNLTDIYKDKSQVDFAYSTQSGVRLRVNAYKESGKDAIALRILADKIPTLQELHVPKKIRELSEERSGLVLVTGPTGSGKSTTLAAMLDWINTTRKCHILTLEDPIEYIHRSKRSFVTQREIGVDSASYADALRAALRQDPDVILVGEMRDYESMAIALQAAETGHLVLSTLHTLGAARTIDRMIGVFPAQEQEQIRTEVSGALRAVISQKLVPLSNGKGRIAVHEIMVVTTAIANNIRENKVAQISTSISTGMEKYGMQSMEYALNQLYSSGKITADVAKAAAIEPRELHLN